MIYKLIVRFRAGLLEFLTHSMALPLLKILRNPWKFPFSSAELSAMKPGTIGRELHDFLDRRSLQLLPYYAKHDIKHVLLGYDTTGEGEVCLQLFMLGNGHKSFPVIATVLFGLLLMPEHYPMFRKAYRRGKAAAYLENIDWFALVPQSLILVRGRLIGGGGVPADIRRSR